MCWHGFACARPKRGGGEHRPEITRTRYARYRVGVGGLPRNAIRSGPPADDNEYMATPPLDIEFTPAALVVRIVRGATEGDPVRMHGAIAATLDIHLQVVAIRDVFTPALRLAREHSLMCYELLADAIQDHLALVAACSGAT